MDEVSHMADLGIDFGAPKVDIAKLRTHKEKVIGKLTGGLAAMAKMRKVTTVRGVGEFVSANHVVVEETTGTGQEKTGTKNSYISRIERGSSDIQISTYYKLIEIGLGKQLNISIG
jgi:pyruvate/2-oxoglutarate dehydrogenase complex dihydrolipoamide dehydrogenase (E3) component